MNHIVTSIAQLAVLQNWQSIKLKKWSAFTYTEIKSAIYQNEMMQDVTY
jgi:hypothetical protein